MKTKRKICRRCSVVPSRVTWVCGGCGTLCCEHYCTAKTSVTAFYSRDGKKDKLFATCGKCWLSNSGWRLIPPAEPTRCDLCDKTPVFRHPSGGLRCRTCPRPNR